MARSVDNCCTRVKEIEQKHHGTFTFRELFVGTRLAVFTIAQVRDLGDELELSIVLIQPFPLS